MGLLKLAIGLSTGIIVFPTILLTKRQLLCKAESRVPPVRIAIIGAGIGGSASAHFARELFGAAASIDVYEASDRIGGRLDTVEVAGREYEAGGSIIHSDNKHMQDFVKHLDLKKLKRSESSDLLGIYNGTDFVFMGSRWKLLNYIKLIWRYGLDLLTIDSWVKRMLKQFNNVYALQQDGKCFVSVPELLTAMGGEEYAALMNKTTRDALKELGLKDRTIDELVTVVTRVNYGQDVTLNAFAGSVSLAGTGGSLWSVEGGNWRVCEALLAKSQANLHKQTKVTEIMKTPRQGSIGTPTYILSTDKGVQPYDIVIIAAPLAVDSYYLSCPKCDNWPEPGSPGDFWQTVATLFSTEINYKHFGLSNIADVPEFIGTTENPANFFNSIGAQHPVENTNSREEVSVRKVFSRKLLTDAQKEELFPKWEDGESKTIPWLAYPDLKPGKHFSSFVLDDGVFYVNAIEHAASAMEMSAVSANNAALLAFKYFSKQHPEVSEPHSDEYAKDEL